MIQPSAPLTLNQRIADQLVGAVAWVRDVSMFVKVVLVGLGALVSGLARVLPLATAPIDVKDTAQGVGLFAVFLGGVALVFLDKNLAGSLKLAADATADLQRVQATAARLAARIEDAQARDRQLRALRAAGVAMRGGLERSLRRLPPDEAETMAELLDVALEELQIAMGFGVGDLWTISIYRAERAPSVVLRRLATRRSNRAEEAQPSREWGPGQGHIGMTWLRAKEVVLEDVTDPAMRHAMNTPADKDSPSDSWRYKSIAAVPVLPDGVSEPWGVVIATSSRGGQFSPVALSAGTECAEAMRVFAGMIALAASIHDIILRKAPWAAHPTQSV